MAKKPTREEKTARYKAEVKITLKELDLPPAALEQIERMALTLLGFSREERHELMRKTVQAMLTRHEPDGTVPPAVFGAYMHLVELRLRELEQMTSGNA